MGPTIPASVATGQIIVDGDDVNTLAGKSPDVGREGGGESLTFTRFLLGNATVVEGEGRHELNIVGALTGSPADSVTDHSQGFGEEIVEGFAVLETFFELGGLARELFVPQFFNRIFKGVNLGDNWLEALELTGVPVEQFGQEIKHA